MIESVNGHAFVNFSAFLGNPKTMHSAPGENRYPRRKSKKKPKKKSKRKTQRDNDRAARFQEKKRQEREAAVAEASPDSPPSHSVPSAVSSPRVEFAFSEPAPADVSADSNFSKMNVDGNVTSVSASDNLTPESEDLDSSRILEALKEIRTLATSVNVKLDAVTDNAPTTTGIEEIQNPRK